MGFTNPCGLLNLGFDSFEIPSYVWWIQFISEGWNPADLYLNGTWNEFNTAGFEYWIINDKHRGMQTRRKPIYLSTLHQERI